MAPLLVADASQPHTGALTGVLLEFARGGAEWVLWLLVILFIGVFIVLFERLMFLRRVAADSDGVRAQLVSKLGAADVEGALETLVSNDSMQANVIAYGLREADRGPEAVAELCSGAIGVEKLRYERRLSFLATVGSNAPFIGLFGTVMGVIMAFDQLQASTGGDAPGTPGSGVMGAIAEALIATGVGLLVAIPAIIFYNLLKLRVNRTVSETRLLVQTVTAYLRHPDISGAQPTAASDDGSTTATEG